MPINPHEFQSIVVLTGAGVSAESGIATFRDSGGLWEQHRVEEVASPAGFRRDPELVHRFYNLRRRQLIAEARPNPAHAALARFQRDFPGELLLVTQNVDHLHEEAGATRVVHMHGELLKQRCTRSGQVSDCREDLSTGSLCRCCQTPAPLRPHIVWFGETPLEMELIDRALASCDLFVAIGTSGHVYPAAGFVDAARAAGAKTVALNLEPSANSHCFDLQELGPASEVVPAFFTPNA
ncbi:NAD-dependent protein deacylase [Posidoniimonas corsicana]|uniref:NAD-dependent protein deacylase n=2 Tax=Posidoniimonas corsicana TaxID=1938618 RepID=A0A5C5V0F3_9BACT|nr:NAD-dependent protein deacylase [Posidoniimonas corsicana]